MDKVTEHLIEGCRRGDRSSQLKLYKQYAQRLYIACSRIVGNSSEAEEAMQDSFLKIFTRLDQSGRTGNGRTGRGRNPIFRGTDKGSYQEVAGRLPHNPLALPL